jgi:hypothetical protein
VSVGRPSHWHRTAQATTTGSAVSTRSRPTVVDSASKTTPIIFSRRRMPTTPFRQSGPASEDPSAGGDADIQMGIQMEPSGKLDCYPYTFSPLLLFAQEHYFDPGYSNYNSVAQFFASCLEPMGVDMLDNVLYDRKNMLYEELLELVTSKRMLVTCCIDAHFTAFQVVGPNALVYYDPLRQHLTHVTSVDGYRKFVLFLLLKCSYADSQHIQENKNHYTGQDSNPTRRMIYDLWRNINKLDTSMLSGVRSRPLLLNLGKYLLVNDSRDPKRMSTQATGNTCYFQVGLSAVPPSMNTSLFFLPPPFLLPTHPSRLPTEPSRSRCAPLCRSTSSPSCARWASPCSRVTRPPSTCPSSSASRTPPSASPSICSASSCTSPRDSCDRSPTRTSW